MQELQVAPLASKLSRGHFSNAQGREADSADKWEDTDTEPTILSIEDKDTETSNREVATEEENASDG